MLFFSLVWADPPLWEDTPNDYDFTASMTAVVYDDGATPLGDVGDLLAAFDVEGNVRGISLMQDGIGPSEGITLHAITIRSNAAGDEISFQYYDASQDEVYNVQENYTFVINDGPPASGNLITPYILNICALPDFNLYLTNNGSVLYSTSIAIGGFQFTVDGTTVNSASGGDAGDAGFSITNSTTTVLGFSFSGGTILPGCGTLVVLNLSGTSTGLSGIVVSDAIGNNLGFTYIGSPVQFQFNQSSLQASYFFDSVDINGLSVNAYDWVGAFNGDECVGSRKWDTSLCGSGVCEVIVMGNDGNEFTDGYCTLGDVVTFKIYDASKYIYINAYPSEDIPWLNNGFNSIDSLTTTLPGCTDDIACNYNSNATEDNGSCTYAEGTCDCDGNPIDDYCNCDGNIEDCAGVCDGPSAVDECGVCGGSGIPDGECDCAGNVVDCAGVCGGDGSACDESECEAGVCLSIENVVIGDGSCSNSQYTTQAACEANSGIWIENPGILDIHMTNHAGCSYCTDPIYDNQEACEIYGDDGDGDASWEFDETMNEKTCESINGNWFDGHIAGFQFELFGMTITGIGGGTASQYFDFVDFNVSTNLILGVSISGGTMPPGEDILTQVTFENYLGEGICFGTDLINNVVSDAVGNEVNGIIWGDCFHAGCTDELACNYDSGAIEDDGSCEYAEFECEDGALVCEYAQCPEAQPSIEVQPDALSSNLYSGEADSSQTITISNTGGSDLSWSAVVSENDRVIPDNTMPDDTKRQVTFNYDLENIPGVLLVRYRYQAKASFVREIEEYLSITEKRYFQSLNMYIYEFDKNKDIVEVFDWVNMKEDVVYAEANYIVEPFYNEPNDQYFDYLWGMHNTGQTGGVPGADINAVAAWDVEQGSAEIVVGVIDSGIDYYHPDLAQNMWKNSGEIPENGIDDDGNGYVDDYYGYNFADNNSSPYDNIGHGTHCAGTIAAVGNNGIGVAGVSWNTKVAALKWGGWTAQTVDAVEAVMYANMMNFDITSNSWHLLDGYSQGLRDAIESSQALFVNAAGNSWLDMDVMVDYPTSYDLDIMLTVAATDPNDYLVDVPGWWGSNYGLTTVDVAAPGLDIFSTVPNGYEYYSGTSMSCPHVAGVAALVLSRNPNLHWSELKDVIMISSDPQPDLDGKCVTGARVNAYNALMEAVAPWLILAEDSGVIIPDSSQDIQVTLDASEMNGGDYSANIVINSNDPDNSQVSVSALLNVTGIPNISLPQMSLDFGDIFVEYSDTLELIVANVGTDILSVYNIDIDNMEFDASPISFELAPDTDQIIYVVYAPLTVGLDEGVMIITSNDPVESNMEVLLSGVGEEPPIIVVTPDSLHADLYTGGMDSSQVFTIRNEGWSDLEVSISVSHENLSFTSILSNDYLIDVQVGNNTIYPEDINVEDHSSNSYSNLELLTFNSTTSNRNVAILQTEENMGTAIMMANVLIENEYDAYPLSPMDIETIDEALYYDVFIIGWSGVFDDVGSYAEVFEIIAECVINYGKGVILTGWGNTALAFGDDPYGFLTEIIPVIPGTGFMAYEDNALDYIESDSPITNGVTSFYTQYAEVPGGIKAGSTVHATFSNGSSAVTSWEYGSGRVVHLGHIYMGDVNSYDNENLFEEESPIRLLTNTIDWSSSSIGDWLTVDPSIATIPPGQYLDIQVTFDAGELLDSTYLASINIHSNDPDENLLNVSVSLSVTEPLDHLEEFSFNQSSSQAFYFVLSGTDLYGEPLESGDWIGLFNDDVCVGARQWLDEAVDVPAMGDDGFEYSAGYLMEGDIPTFRIYDASEDMIYHAEPNVNYGFSATQMFIVDVINGGLAYELILDISANLISFYTLPEDNSIENIIGASSGNVNGILTEGMAAVYINNQWLGTLMEFDLTDGYWMLVNEPSVSLSGLGSTYNPDRVYDLYAGPNLISYPALGFSDLSSSIPDDVEDLFVAILGEGIAAMNDDISGWIGALSSFDEGAGYWVIVSEDLSFSYETGSMARAEITQYIETRPSGNLYNVFQSSQQAFYFVDNIILNEGAIKDEDWLLSYNGNVLTGIRQWQGVMIDIPAMGMEENNQTAGYFTKGDVPTFMLLQQSTGELIPLSGDIPAWTANGVYALSSLTELQPIPADFMLSSAYPNPFNPVTKLSFGIPVEVKVTIDIYNLQGRLIETLVSRQMDAGYHSVIWDADNHASGMYFVKMVAGQYINTQKLMLVK